MKKILFSILFCLNFWSAVGASELCFDEFLTKTINNSYKLKLMRVEKDSADIALKQVKSSYYPSLMSFATTERYKDLTDGNSNITAVGNEILLNRSYYQDMAGLMMSYNLFDFGERRNQYEIANLDKVQKEVLFMKSVLDIELESIAIYSEVLDLYKTRQVKDEIYQLRKDLVEIKKRLKFAGETSEVDVLDFEILANETGTELEEIANSYSKKLEELSYYTGEKYDSISLVLSDFVDIKGKFEELLKKRNFENYLNPEKSYESRIAELEIAKKKKEYDIQKKANYPKVRFDARYNFYGSDPMNFMRGISDISQRSLTFRLSTSIMLFDGFKNTNAIKKKKLEIEKAEIDKRMRLAELSKLYNQLVLDYDSSIRKMNHTVITLNYVNQNLEAVKRLNKAGELSMEDCIRKQIVLLEKKLELEQSFIKHYSTLYKLKFILEKPDVL